MKAPPVSSSLTDTFLVSGGAALDFLLVPVELSSTSSTGAQHSKEVRLLEWVREVLPEEVSPEEVLAAKILLAFFLPGTSVAGASALAAAAATASQ